MDGQLTVTRLLRQAGALFRKKKEYGCLGVGYPHEAGVGKCAYDEYFFPPQNMQGGKFRVLR